MVIKGMVMMSLILLVDDMVKYYGFVYVCMCICVSLCMCMCVCISILSLFDCIL